MKILKILILCNIKKIKMGLLHDTMSFSRMIQSQTFNFPNSIIPNPIPTSAIGMLKPLKRAQSGTHPSGVGEKSGERRSESCHVGIVVFEINAFGIET